MQDPKDPQVLYYGNTNIRISANRGTNWTRLGTLPGTGSVRNIVVDRTNIRILCGVRATALPRSTDGGSIWTNIATGLPTNLPSINHVAVDHGNSNVLRAALSGYSAGNKVFKSVNGGAAWNAYSEGLPNLPVNYLSHEKNTNGGVYAVRGHGCGGASIGTTPFRPGFPPSPTCPT